MRILYVAQGCPHISGGRFQIFTMARESTKIGHEVFLLITEDQSHYPNMKPNVDGVSNLHIIRDYKLRIPNKRYDIIVGTPHMAGIIAEKYATRKKIKFCMVVFETPKWMKKYIHDYSSPDPWREFKDSLKKANIVICNSEETAKQTKDWVGKKCPKTVSIPPSIEDETYADKIKSRNKPYGGIIIGRLNTSRKRLNDAVKAMYKLDTLKICTSTDGCSIERKYRNLHFGDYEIYENVSEENKWRMIKESKGLLMPSSFEGFGMPIAEALYCNIPAFTYDLPVFKKHFDYGGLFTAKLKNTKEYIKTVRNNWGKKVKTYEITKEKYGLKALRDKLKSCYELVGELK